MRKQPSCQMAAFAWVLASEQSQSGDVELQENLSNRLTFLLGTGGARPRDTSTAWTASREAARGHPGAAPATPRYPRILRSRMVPVPYPNSFDARLRPNRSVYRARPIRRACAPAAARTPHPTCGAALRDRSRSRGRSGAAYRPGGALWVPVSTLSGLVGGARPGSLAGPQSTPKSAWRAGEVPALYQRDPAWSDVTYAGDAFGITGRGPTCMAMAYVALTGGTDLSPADPARSPSASDARPRRHRLDVHDRRRGRAWPRRRRAARRRAVRSPRSPVRPPRHLQHGTRRLHQHGPLHRARRHRRTRPPAHARPQQPRTHGKDLGLRHGARPMPTIWAYTADAPRAALARAGRRTKWRATARVALQRRGDVLHRHALDELRHRLEVAVAAAGELNARHLSPSRSTSMAREHTPRGV